MIIRTKMRILFQLIILLIPHPRKSERNSRYILFSALAISFKTLNVHRVTCFIDTFTVSKDKKLSLSSVCIDKLLIALICSYELWTVDNKKKQTFWFNLEQWNCVSAAGLPAVQFNGNLADPVTTAAKKVWSGVADRFCFRFCSFF